jgi:hypothetical protein
VLNRSIRLLRPNRAACCGAELNGAGDHGFESRSLQRRVCEPSVPERRSPFDPGPQPGPSSTREGLRRANEMASFSIISAVLPIVN